MFMSQHQDLQQILFGEIVFDKDFHIIKKIHDDVKDDDDFNICKYIRCIKISMMYYILVPHVLDQKKFNLRLKRNLK
jgi:hypothetical protein